MNQNNEVPTKLHAKLITVATIGAVGGFLFGYDTSVINGAVDAIASPDSGFGLNAAMSGFSVSSAMIGCVVGAWFAGTLADRIGRVRVMQLAAALFVFSALFTGLASKYLGVRDLPHRGRTWRRIHLSHRPRLYLRDIAVVTPRIPHRLPTDGHRLGHRGLPCGQ